MAGMQREFLAGLWPRGGWICRSCLRGGFSARTKCEEGERWAEFRSVAVRWEISGECWVVLS